LAGLTVFPIAPPIAPMLAKLARVVPDGDFLYEPKWDGFRVLVFRDGDEIYLQSRDERPFLRYFPELAEPLRQALPPRAVVDGEIVVPVDGRLGFDTLQMRLHPAESRVRKLAAEFPASVILFDLLAVGDEDLRDRPFAERRARLEAAVRVGPTVLVTPSTRDRAAAEDWFARFEGAGLDGVMAKPLDGRYEAGKRALVKTKHDRTLDCAVAGFRWHESGDGVGSLILGLFDEKGAFQQIGVAAGFSAKLRRELAEKLEPLRADAMAGHPWESWADHERRPGVQSRWNAGKDLTWEPVRMELVAEVSANQLTGGRLRHPAKLLRFRPDRLPRDCRADQLDEAPPALLSELFG
jgi:ATP-dependent DNA ligase